MSREKSFCRTNCILSISKLEFLRGIFIAHDTCVLLHSSGGVVSCIYIWLSWLRRLQCLVDSVRSKQRINLNKDSLQTEMEKRSEPMERARRSKFIMTACYLTVLVLHSGVAYDCRIVLLPVNLVLWSHKTWLGSGPNVQSCVSNRGKEYYCNSLFNKILKVNLNITKIFHY